MTPTKYNLTHYEQLKQMEKQLSEQLFSRQKKGQMAYTNDHDFATLETEIAELEEPLYHIQMAITSFSKTFQIT